MTQGNSSKVSAEILANITLHPMLREALDSLDLDLEAELARYRQITTGGLAGTLDAFSTDTEVNSDLEFSSFDQASETEPGFPALTDPPPSPLEFDDAEVHAEAFEPEDQESQPLIEPELTVPALDLAALLSRSTPRSEDAPKSLPAAATLSPDQPIEQMPVDYLASTEALLNSLVDADLDAERPIPHPPARHVPLGLSFGVASLIIIGGGLIYSLLSQGLPQVSQQTPAPKRPKVVTPSPHVSAQPKASLSANLAASEFQRLDQTSLSILEPGSSPTGSTLAPTATNQTVRVVILNADAELLSQVQEIIPDAFLEPSAQGAKIQLGIFQDLNRAKSLIAQVQEQGLTAVMEPL